MIWSPTCSNPSVFPFCSQRSSDPFKVWPSRPLAGGRPTCPGLPGIFLVLALEVLHPENPFTSVQTGMVSHPAFGIWSLAAFPSSSSIFFGTQCSINIKLLVPQTVPSLSCLTTFVHASLCLGWSSGLIFLHDGLLSHPLWGAFSVPSGEHGSVQTALIYGIFGSSLFFSAVFFFITCRTNMRRKAADMKWVTMAKKEYKGNGINQYKC